MCFTERSFSSRNTSYNKLCNCRKVLRIVKNSKKTQKTLDSTAQFAILTMERGEIPYEQG